MQSVHAIQFSLALQKFNATQGSPQQVGHLQQHFMIHTSFFPIYIFYSSQNETYKSLDDINDSKESGCDRYSRILFQTKYIWCRLPSRPQTINTTHVVRYKTRRDKCVHTQHTQHRTQDTTHKLSGVTSLPSRTARQRLFVFGSKVISNRVLCARGEVRLGFCRGILRNCNIWQWSGFISC